MSGVDGIFAVYLDKGSNAYGGERVNQLEHALQTAMLAEHSAARLPRLAGEPVATPWDCGLAAAMARHDVRIEEELSLDTLLADLA